MLSQSTKATVLHLFSSKTDVRRLVTKGQGLVEVYFCQCKFRKKEKEKRKKMQKVVLS